MSILGIAESTVASLVRPLTDPALDRDAVAECFARASWTGIAEPGDRIAGRVVAGLGAERALGALLDDRGGGLLRHALEEADVALSTEEVSDAVARWTPRISKQDALRALRQAARFGMGIIVPGDPDWPAALDDLGEHAPIALWVRGQREAIAALGRAVAIVGARAATGYGEHVAIELAAGLVDRGYAIVSGAAYGIDGAAHRSALASRGTTVAFLAGGLDRFYPSGHDALLERITTSGAAVSEVPCGVPPTKWRFLQRNRLIAAASLATVVVEAGARSGSLNTAGHAAALGRPLGAVPGPVTSASSAGCHRLLREFDAVCVTSADQIAELAPLDQVAQLSVVDSGIDDGIDDGTVGGRMGGGHTDGLNQHPAHDGRGADPTGTRIRLLDALSTRGVRSVERLAALSGLAVDRVCAELGLLSLEGLVVERASGWLRVAEGAERRR